MVLNRHDFLQKYGIIPLFGDHSLCLLRANGPLIMSNDYLEHYSLGKKVASYGTIWIATDAQQRNLMQLTLLDRAALHSEMQGLSDQAFKRHVKYLFANIGMVIAVHDLQSKASTWNFALSKVYGANKPDYEFAELADQINGQLAIIPPGTYSQNFWQYNIMPDKQPLVTIADINHMQSTGSVTLTHSWLVAMNARDIARTQMLVSKNYHLAAQVA